MTALSINVNKIALIRNSRGANSPDLLAFSKHALDLGVQGITVHPRPDQRHIRYADLLPLRHLVSGYDKCEFNIEGYPTDTFLEHAIHANAHQVTFVPDPPEALTSSFGWDVRKHQDFLTDVIAKLHDHGIRTSLFVDPDFSDFEALLKTRTDRVEFYTGPYAAQFHQNKEAAVALYARLASKLQAYSIGINAGHDLNLDNTAYFLENVDTVLEVSIGHQVICDALVFGWEHTIKSYLACVRS